jgi:hypothetical protein
MAGGWRLGKETPTPTGTTPAAGRAVVVRVSRVPDFRGRTNRRGDA